MEDNVNENFEKKIVEAEKKLSAQNKVRREKVVPGSHLLQGMLEVASAAGLTTVQKTGWYKITGTVKGQAVYLSVKGGHVSLSGFCIDDPACKPLTPEEAKARHLGRVRGELDFGKSDEEIKAAYFKALQALCLQEPEASAAQTEA